MQTRTIAISEKLYSRLENKAIECGINEELEIHDYLELMVEAILTRGINYIKR